MEQEIQMTLLTLAPGEVDWEEYLGAGWADDATPGSFDSSRRFRKKRTGLAQDDNRKNRHAASSIWELSLRNAIADSACSG